MPATNAAGIYRFSLPAQILVINTKRQGNMRQGIK